MKRKLAMLLVLCMMATAVFSGCGSSGDTTEDPAGGEEGPTASAGDGAISGTASDVHVDRDDLNLFSNTAIAVLDPHESKSQPEVRIMLQIFEPLVYVDTGFVEHMKLATDYTISDDNLTYTFNIREGVKFHDGSDMTMEDIVFSYERAMESAYMDEYTSCIASVADGGDNQFVVTLKQPTATFLNYVSYIFIVSKAAVEQYGDDFKTNPVGTGAYRLTNFEGDTRINVEAFPEYWDGEAPIKNVTWKVITDSSARYMALESGEIDFASILSTDWPAAQANEDFETLKYDTNACWYITLNFEVEPFNNPLVRKALAHAIDRESIIAVATDGMSPAALVRANPDMVFGATDDCVTYEYDLEKAKEYLVEAGYPDGFDMGDMYILSGTMDQIAAIYQQDLAKLGIDVNIVTVQPAALQSDLYTGNYASSVMVTSNYAYDMDGYKMHYTIDMIGSGNYSRYRNETVDQLFKDAVATTDKAEREALYKEAIQIIQEECVDLPIYYTTNLYAYTKGLNLTLYGNYYLVNEWSWN